MLNPLPSKLPTFCHFFDACLDVRRLIIWTFLLFGVAQNAASQITETVFYDTLSKVSSEGIVTGGYGEGKYMYITGGAFSNSKPLPSVTKIDTSGNVIWTALNQEAMSNFTESPNLANIAGLTSLLLKDGNRIFTSGLRYQLWSIDDNSGVLLWSSPMTGSIIKICDFTSTELLVLTNDGLRYSIVNKETGNIVFSRQMLSGAGRIDKADIAVDNNRNILIAWGDTCYKYRDRQLSQLLWKSSLPYFSNKSVEKIVLDSGQYILSGLNNVRAVDSSTGNVIWYTNVPVGYVFLAQSGATCDPRKVLVRDSLIYISWISPYVGGLDFRRSFALSCINKSNGQIRYNVAYDFIGVPADPPPPTVQEELDWPMDFCMDANSNIYITGSYDQSAGPQNSGNWGIMKLNGSTGAKMYEATITLDSSNRNAGSQGLYVDYKFGKLYAAGNLARKYNTIDDTKPLLVSFDSSATYKELFRASPFFTTRYPSSLEGFARSGNAKMVLLKRVGRSAVVEMRGEYNQLLWSRLFSSANKFVVPQLVGNLHDSAIAASFLLYKEEPVTRVLVGLPDSVIFVRLDTVGNIKYLRQLAQVSTDSIAPEPVQLYIDDNNKTNFFYRRWEYHSSTNTYLPYYFGYMLDGTGPAWSSINGTAILREIIANKLRKTVVSHVSKDTLALYYTTTGILASVHFGSTIQAPDYKGFLLKRVRKFQAIYSSITVDSTTQVVFGRDSSGQMLAARYDYRRPDPLVWNSPQSAGTMFAADTSSAYLYVIGSLLANNAMTISKMDKATGAVAWTVQKTAQPRTSLIPIDFRYDPVNGQFTVGGYYADSSFYQPQTGYFYFTLDTNGVVVQDVTRKGELYSNTQITTINTLQRGSHFYGGRLGTSKWGIAGFYNASCLQNIFIPSVSISTASNPVCSGATAIFKATPLAGGTDPKYNWELNGRLVGGVTDTFVADTLQNNDRIDVRLTSNAACLKSDTARSNIIEISVIIPINPGVKISGNTNVYPGATTIINASTSNAGISNAFQWQDSTSSHGWQELVGSTDSTLSYRPRATGDQLRCILKASNDCVKGYFATSNQISFVLDNNIRARGIRYYPNPVRDILYIENLTPADQWRTVEIVSLKGSSAQTFAIEQNQRDLQLNLGRLARGLYVAILHSNDQKPVYLKFLKL